MSIKNIDFNTDITQMTVFANNETGAGLFELVSTVNIPCLYTPENRLNLKERLLFCKEKKLTISALICADNLLKDEESVNNLDEDEIDALVFSQLGALSAYTKAYSLTVDTVRPSGILYKAAGRNYETALKFAKAVRKIDKWLNFTCPDNEIADQLESETNIPVNREIIVDGIYTPDYKYDFDSSERISEEDALNRIRTILHSSQIKVGSGIFMPVKCSTLHFNSENAGVSDLLKKANEIVLPSQPNYNKAELSGWL